MVLILENCTLFTMAVICINTGCFTSKCMHKTWFHCGQTALKQGHAIWLTAQFEINGTLCKGFVNEMDVQSLFAAIQQLQKPHNPSVNQGL